MPSYTQISILVIRISVISSSFFTRTSQPIPPHHLNRKHRHSSIMHHEEEPISYGLPLYYYLYTKVPEVVKPMLSKKQDIVNNPFTAASRRSAKHVQHSTSTSEHKQTSFHTQASYKTNTGALLNPFKKTKRRSSHSKARRKRFSGKSIKALNFSSYLPDDVIVVSKPSISNENLLNSKKLNLHIVNKNGHKLSKPMIKNPSFVTSKNKPSPNHSIKRRSINQDKRAKYLGNKDSTQLPERLKNCGYGSCKNDSETAVKSVMLNIVIGNRKKPISGDSQIESRLNGRLSGNQSLFPTSKNEKAEIKTHPPSRKFSNNYNNTGDRNSSLETKIRFSMNSTAKLLITKSGIHAPRLKSPNYNESYDVQERFRGPSNLNISSPMRNDTVIGIKFSNKEVGMVRVKANFTSDEHHQNFTKLNNNTFGLEDEGNLQLRKDGYSVEKTFKRMTSLSIINHQPYPVNNYETNTLLPLHKPDTDDTRFKTTNTKEQYVSAKPFTQSYHVRPEPRHDIKSPRGHADIHPPIIKTSFHGVNGTKGTTPIVINIPSTYVISRFFYPFSNSTPVYTPSNANKTTEKASINLASNAANKTTFDNQTVLKECKTLIEPKVDLQTQAEIIDTQSGKVSGRQNSRNFNSEALSLMKEDTITYSETANFKGRASINTQYSKNSRKNAYVTTSLSHSSEIIDVSGNSNFSTEHDDKNYSSNFKSNSATRPHSRVHFLKRPGDPVQFTKRFDDQSTNFTKKPDDIFIHVTRKFDNRFTEGYRSEVLKLTTENSKEISVLSKTRTQRGTVENTNILRGMRGTKNRSLGNHARHRNEDNFNTSKTSIVSEINLTNVVKRITASKDANKRPNGNPYTRKKEQITNQENIFVTNKNSDSSETVNTTGGLNFLNATVIKTAGNVKNRFAGGYRNSTIFENPLTVNVDKKYSNINPSTSESSNSLPKFSIVSSSNATQIPLSQENPHSQKITTGSDNPQHPVLEAMDNVEFKSSSVSANGTYSSTHINVENAEGMEPQMGDFPLNGSFAQSTISYSSLHQDKNEHNETFSSQNTQTEYQFQTPNAVTQSHEGTNLTEIITEYSDEIVPKSNYENRVKPRVTRSSESSISFNFGTKIELGAEKNRDSKLRPHNPLTRNSRKDFTATIDSKSPLLLDIPPSSIHLNSEKVSETIESLNYATTKAVDAVTLQYSTSKPIDIEFKEKFSTSVSPTNDKKEPVGYTEETMQIPIITTKDMQTERTFITSTLVIPSPEGTDSVGNYEKSTKDKKSDEYTTITEDYYDGKIKETIVGSTEPNTEVNSGQELWTDSKTNTDLEPQRSLTENMNEEFSNNDLPGVESKSSIPDIPNYSATYTLLPGTPNSSSIETKSSVQGLPDPSSLAVTQSQISLPTTQTHSSIDKDSEKVVKNQTDISSITTTRDSQPDIKIQTPISTISIPSTADENTIKNNVENKMNGVTGVTRVDFEDVTKPRVIRSSESSVDANFGSWTDIDTNTDPRTSKSFTTNTQDDFPISNTEQTVSKSSVSDAIPSIPPIAEKISTVYENINPSQVDTELTTLGISVPKLSVTKDVINSVSTTKEIPVGHKGNVNKSEEGEVPPIEVKVTTKIQTLPPVTTTKQSEGTYSIKSDENDINKVTTISENDYEGEAKPRIIRSSESSLDANAGIKTLPGVEVESKPLDPITGDAKIDLSITSSADAKLSIPDTTSYLPLNAVNVPLIPESPEPNKIETNPVIPELPAPNPTEVVEPEVSVPVIDGYPYSSTNTAAPITELTKNIQYTTESNPLTAFSPLNTQQTADQTDNTLTTENIQIKVKPQTSIPVAITRSPSTDSIKMPNTDTSTKTNEYSSKTSDTSASNTVTASPKNEQSNEISSSGDDNVQVQTDSLTTEGKLNSESVVTDATPLISVSTVNIIQATTTSNDETSEYIAENPINLSTKKTVIIEELATTERLATTKGFSTTGRPATAEKPATTERPTTAEKLATTERPATTLKIVDAGRFATAEVPTALETPATTLKIVNEGIFATTEVPTASEIPATTLKIVNEGRFATAEVPTAPERPATTGTQTTISVLKPSTLAQSSSTKSVYTTIQSSEKLPSQISTPPNEIIKANVTSISFQFTMDADFDKVVGKRKSEFERSLQNQLGIVMRLPFQCIHDLKVSKGSIDVSFNLVPSPDHGHIADEKAIKAASDELKRLIDSGKLDLNDLDGNSLVVVPIDPPTSAPVAAAEHTTLILGVIIAVFILTVIMVIVGAIIIKRKSNYGKRLSPIEEVNSKLPSYRNIPFQEALYKKGSGTSPGVGKYCYKSGQWLGPGPEPKNGNTPSPVCYKPPSERELRRTPRPPTAVVISESHGVRRRSVTLSGENSDVW